MVARILRPLAAVVPWAAALLLAGAAPLRAQEESAGTCAPAAEQPDADWLVRWVCTGAGYDAAVRLALAVPVGWEFMPPDGTELLIAAQGEGAGVFVSAQDQLHAPRTRPDSMGFWMRATRLHLGAEPGLADVEAFQSLAGDPAGARRAVTLAQQADSALLAVALGRSAARDGGHVLHQFAEVRTLVGHPAGFLEETYVTGGHTWRIATYVTVHDATVFVASFAAPEEEFRAAYPSWVQVYASLKLGTERDESAPRPAP
ncbi:MAG TPA: hypothetical protein VE871_14085 [Longimicrobium sp.]|nr:hypothetical protein [Longimicrobium sp.]